MTTRRTSVQWFLISKEEPASRMPCAGSDRAYPVNTDTWRQFPLVSTLRGRFPVDAIEAPL